jgi:hypothetical protein
MTRTNEARELANFLTECLKLGWKKSDLDMLQAIWEKYKREYFAARGINI